MSEHDQIERLADQLIAATPSLDRSEQAVALALLRLLAEGAPVSDRQLAAAVGAEESTIADELAPWPGVFRDEDDRVVGFMGLSVGRVRRAPDRGGRTHADRVVRVGHAVPPRAARSNRTGSFALSRHRRADLADRRPRCGERGAARGLAVLSFLAPERPFDSDVVSSFCHFVHFFASERAAGKWIAGTRALSRSRSSRGSAWAGAPTEPPSEARWTARTSPPEGDTRDNRARRLRGGKIEEAWLVGDTQELWRSLGLLNV
jgi:hypothetical protein